MNVGRSMKSKWSLVLMSAVAAVVLQGCADFRPLYGTNGAEESTVVSELSNIQIPPPRDRLHQVIRNNLISTMSPPGQEGNGRYTLVIDAAPGSFDVTIARNTDITRRSFRLRVNFILNDSTTGRRIYSGSTFSEVAYDKVTSEFTNLQAEKNAQERAALEVSQDIRTRLAAFFATYRSS